MLVIEAIRTAWRELGRLPRLSRIGLVLMLAALVGDTIIRLLPAAHQHAAHRPDEHAAHLVALGAMVLVMTGLAIDARRHRSRRRSSDAHR